MLSVTVVLFRPNPGDFSRTVHSLLQNADSICSIHILVSGTTAEFRAIATLTEKLAHRTSCILHHRFDNLGFASGHNFLMDEAFAMDAKAVLVLNPDIIIQAGAIGDLLAQISGPQPVQGLVGPTLRRASEHGLLEKTFDSAGIEWTSSGRHYDKFQGEPWSIVPGRLDRVSGVTGACLLVSRESYNKIICICGYFFDDLFLAYREDAELGIRAGKLGVPSSVLHTEGFAHVRSVRGYKRGNRLADLLGVRNRFLLRWSLGSFRPGNAAVAKTRDILVVLASLLIERSSVPGLKDAFAIRGYANYRGQKWRRLS